MAAFSRLGTNPAPGHHLGCQCANATCKGGSTSVDVVKQWGTRAASKAADGACPLGRGHVAGQLPCISSIAPQPMHTDSAGGIEASPPCGQHSSMDSAPRLPVHTRDSRPMARSLQPYSRVSGMIATTLRPLLTSQRFSLQVLAGLVSYWLVLTAWLWMSSASRVTMRSCRRTSVWRKRSI